MSDLIIKFPTRSRPEKFRRVLTQCRDRLSGHHHVRFVISCDVLDFSMNNRTMRRWLDEFAQTSDLVYHFGWSWTKVQAVNANLKGESADALLLVSDDMNPVLDNFDEEIFATFAEHFPSFHGAIKFHDGRRDDDLMTYPVLGWPLYQSFGYIYQPGYLSIYCDNEQTESCRSLDCLAISDRCLFRHEWTSDAIDLLHLRNENRFMHRIDGRRFTRRERHNFEIDRVRRALKYSGEKGTLFDS